MRPVVHQHTWHIVKQLARKGRAPEWKVLHLAVLLLEQRVGELPEALDLLAEMGGDLGDAEPAPPDGGA